MALYTSDLETLTPIQEQQFSKESELQKLCEKNLETLMGLQFVKSEFTIKHRRIDTLAFDQVSKAFVIIEYKRSRNYSVVDQGIAYLQLMLENKAEFIIEYNESTGGSLKRSDIDWSQSRLVFVSPSFTQDQIEATNFRDLNVELFEVKRFKGGLINVVHHEAKSSAPSFKEIGGSNKGAEEVKKEIKSYSEQQHFERGTEESIELYKTFRDAILNSVDGSVMKPFKQEISFRKKRPFAFIKIQKGGIKLWINAKFGELDDPRNLGRDMRGIGHHGVGDYEFKIEDESDLDYILGLINQAVRKLNFD